MSAVSTKWSPRPASSPALRVVLASVLLQWASGVQADAPVQHEYLPDLEPHEAALRVRRARGEELAVEYEGELLDTPDLEGDAPVPTMTGRPGDGVGREGAGLRSPSFRPDRMTKLEGRLSYYSAFNPVVAPFKRVTSLDQVVMASDGRTPVLTVADAAHAPLPVQDPQVAASDGRPRDRFWGEVELDFRAGRAVPLPSVAPASRLLSVRTRPESRISFVRDGADNFFAVLEGGAQAGTVRMAYLMDAPQAYFGMEIPEAPVGALAAAVAPMPDAVKRQALRFARELGLSQDSALREALHVLTGHFRGFEESDEPPPDTGAIFLDLARGKRGICRHRSYAFVIAAQSLGIPSRFVQNEAHSFVEVRLPERGWMRIDLGGAANGLTAHGARDRPLYRPLEPDRLPRPEAYVRSYSQSSSQMSGLRARGLSSQGGGWIAPASGLPGFGGGEATQVDGTQAQSLLPMPAVDSQVGGRRRQVVTVSVDRGQYSALRGHLLSVAGALRDARAQPVGGLRVEISLAAPDRSARLLLGVTVSGPDGRYSAELGVPADLPAGDYELVVLTPGDAEYMPAVAQ